MATLLRLKKILQIFSGPGAPAVMLVNSELWWHGPTWLKEAQCEWPDSTSSEDKLNVQEIIEAEVRSKFVMESVATVDPVTPI